MAFPNILLVTFPKLLTGLLQRHGAATAANGTLLFIICFVSLKLRDKNF